MAMDAIHVVAICAANGFERAEVGIRESAGEHAPDAGRGFDDDDAGAAGRCMEGSGNSGGSSTEDDDVGVERSQRGEKEREHA